MLKSRGKFALSQDRGVKMKNHLAIILFILISNTTFAQTVDFGSFTDPRDGAQYKTITIGSQTWMAENLNYNAGSGSWAYDNDSSKSATYGRLYSWQTARKACPKGWRLPSDVDWQTLVEYLGGPVVAGGKMKEAGAAHWKSPNTGANNGSGFSALPAGYYYDGKFYDMGSSASFWSSTASGSENHYVWHRFLFHSISAVYRYRYSYTKFGYSVRCVRDVGASDAGLAYLKTLVGRKKLDLKGAGVTDKGLKHLAGLAGLENLEALNLKGADVTDTGLVHLKGMVGLKDLDLEDTSVSDAGLVHLKGLPKLEKLWLEDIPISDKGLEHLACLENLELLVLENTSVSDAGLVHLNSMKNLKKLDLSKTMVTKAGIAELQKALPNLTIE